MVISKLKLWQKTRKTLLISKGKSNFKIFIDFLIYNGLAPFITIGSDEQLFSCTYGYKIASKMYGLQQLILKGGECDSKSFSVPVDDIFFIRRGIVLYQMESITLLWHRAIEGNVYIPHAPLKYTLFQQWRLA